jgi:hypothetical protein
VTIILPIGVPPQLEFGTAYNPKFKFSDSCIIKVWLNAEQPPKSITPK